MENNEKKPFLTKEKKIKITVIFLSLLALMLVLLWSGILPESVNETFCNLLTGPTQRLMGDACN